MKIKIENDTTLATEFKAGDFAVEVTYGSGLLIEVIEPATREGMRGFIGKYIADITERYEDDIYKAEINKASTDVFCGFAPNCAHYGPNLYKATIINKE